MTHEEALTYLEDLQQLAERYLIEAQIPTVKALNVAIEAVKKQMPKKPIVENTGEFDVFECPSCSFSVGFTNGLNGTLYKHCNYCGQAIDWSTP